MQNYGGLSAYTKSTRIIPENPESKRYVEETKKAGRKACMAYYRLFTDHKKFFKNFFFVTKTLQKCSKILIRNMKRWIPLRQTGCYLQPC